MASYNMEMQFMSSDEVTIFPGMVTSVNDWTVTWSSKYNRRKINAYLEELIDQIWTEKRRSNPRLFDAAKFRLDSWQMHGDENRRKVHINLGLTSYREFIGTNCSKVFAEAATSAGAQVSADLLADPLGVGGVVETADEHVVCIKRSDWCGEAPGLIDIPGGHPEPQEIVDLSMDNDVILELNSVAPDIIINEIYNSVRKEIVDEVNISAHLLSQPTFLGFIRNNITQGRPGAQFYFKTSLTSNDVRTLYEKRTQKEADESTEILFISKNFFKSPISSSTHSQFHWKNLTPSAKGAFMLLNQVK